MKKIFIGIICICLVLGIFVMTQLPSMASVETGALAPDFTLPDMNGQHKA